MNNDFELWWRGEDQEFRDDIRKKDAKRIWDAAYRAGGAQPWWSVTREQLQVLFEQHGMKKK